MKTGVLSSALIIPDNIESQQAALNLLPGINIQEYSPVLNTLSNLNTAAGKLPYFVGTNSAEVTDITPAGRALLDDFNTTQQRQTLGVEIGVNVQAYNSKLNAISNSTPSANYINYYTGTTTVSSCPLHYFSRSLLSGDYNDWITNLNISNKLDFSIYASTSGNYSSVYNTVSATSSNWNKWGSITGTLSSQTDLKNILDDKLSITSGGTLSSTLYLAPSTSANCALCFLPGGTRPLSSNIDAGDMWFEHNGLFFKSNDGIQQLDYGANTVGSLQKISIVDNGSGGITAGSGLFYFYSGSAWTGDYSSYEIPSTSGLTLTDLATNYLIADYNNGSPIYSITTDPNIINNSNKVIVANMSREGNYIHYIPVDWGKATSIRNNNRNINIQRFVRSSGLTLSESSGMLINIGSGVVWYGCTSFAEASASSVSDGAIFYYHSGGNWTRSTVSTYNNSQYDSGTALSAVSNNKYVVNWVFRYIDGDNLPKIAYVLGRGDYTLLEAQNSSVPSIPTYLDRSAILVGRIIVQSGSTTSYQIDSAFTQTFTSSIAIQHNDLGGIQGGNINQYYHVTSGQNSLITSIEATSANLWNNTLLTVSSNSSTWGSGNSSKYDSVYNTVSANSSTWGSGNNTKYDSAYNTVSANSSIWNSSYTTLSANSGNWVNTSLGFNPSSAKFLSAFNTLSANSGVWNSAYNTLSATSSNWVNTSLGFNPSSGKFLSAFNTLSANSGNFISVYNTVSANSSTWTNAYNTLSSNSADWMTIETTVATSSSNWNNVYNTVSANSASWDGNLGSSVFSTVSANSSNWNNASTNISSSSSNWNDASTNISSSSALWNNVANAVTPSSAKFLSSFNTLSANSGNWVNTSLGFNPSSGKFLSAFNQVSAFSGTWQSAFTTLSANSGIWNSVYNTVSANSSTWQNTTITVSANSSIWNNTYTSLSANSGNYNSVYSTVNSKSGDWCNYAGFANRTDSTITLADSTITSAAFVISGNYNFWTNGTKYTKTTSVSTVINNDQSLHYVYFDTVGNLCGSLTPWNITSGSAPIALVYKDSNNYTLNEERHGYQRDRDWHKWAHLTIGARYGSGFTSTFTNTTLSVAQGVVYDEDIDNDTLTTKTNCSLWYRNNTSTAMRFEQNITTPYKAIADVLQYDSGSGLTPVTNTNYVCNYVYATNDKINPIYVVIGQAQYNSVTNARNDALPTLLLSTAEWKLIYRTIYRNVGSVPTFIESTDYRNVSSGPAGTSVINDHQSLINRSADNAHPQSAITGLTSGDIANFAGVNVLGSTIPTNGIYLPTTNTVGIATNSTKRIEIDTTGNVYLDSNLRIRYGTQLGFFANAVSYGVWGGGINTYPSINMGSSSNHPLILGTNNNGQVIIDSSGNVGIGTTSILSPLEIYRDTNSSNGTLYPNIRLNNNNSSGYSGLYFTRGSNIKAALQMKNDVGDFEIYTSDTKRMTITSAGNVTNHNFTKLGGATDNPAIKIKKLTGTTGTSNTDPDNKTTMPHGLTGDKIIGVSVIVRSATNSGILPSSQQTGNNYYVDYDGTNVYVRLISGANIYSKSVCATITYEE